MSGGRDRTPEEEKTANEEFKQFLKDNPDFPTKADYKKIIEENKKNKTYEKYALKLDNYMDNVEKFYQINPFFYDKTGMFWLWNTKEYKYEICDDTTLMSLIDEQLGFVGQTVNKGIKGNYLEAFKRVGRKHEPKTTSKNWVQFKNKIIDLETGKEHEANPQYFMTNPIPWPIGTTGEIPTIEKLFTDWQGENKETLFEILAYCLLSDYPIHTIIANIGSGRNGKTQFMKILEKLLGIENITSTELDTLIDNRFESAKLYKKLACTMGETNFTVINKTSLLKKLCGGDLIGYEFKNKMPFTGHNYAKIIINTNSLPPSNDTTEGFYRRWLIVHWDNCFKEGKDIVDTIPEREYSELCHRLLFVLKNLLDRGYFRKQGDIVERKQKYILASNPITLFLAERCDISDSAYVKAKDLYHAYISYLQEKKRRIIKRKEFNQILAEEGYQAEHDKRKVERDGQVDWENSYWVDGLKLKEISLISQISPVSPTLFPTHGKKVEKPREIGEGLSLNFPNFTFEDLISIILDRVPQEIEVDALISLGAREELLQKWKDDGLIFEPRSGFIRLI